MPAVLTGRSARQAKERAALEALEAQETVLNLAENDPAPSEEAGKSDTPTPEVPQEVAPEVHIPTPEVVAEQVPTPKEEVDWKREAETWKKRKGESDAALGPFQQVAAHEKRRSEALENKLQERDAVISSFRSELGELKQLIASIQPGASTQAIREQVAESDAFSPEIQELVDSFPEVAKVSAAIAAQTKRELLQQFGVQQEKLNAELEARKRDEAAAKAKADFEYHHGLVAASHPDIDAIYRDAPEVLASWAENESPEYLMAVKNPLSVSPRMFIKIMNEFKGSLNPRNGSRKPANGDIAVRAKSATVPSINGNESEEKEIFLTDDEFKKFPRLVQNAIFAKNFDEVKRLEAGYENTARRKENE